MLERFIADYSERAYQFAYRLCGDAEEAKELVQEAFFRAIRHWDQFDQSQPLESWYNSILGNLYRDTVKRYDRRNSVSLEIPVAGSEGELTLGETLRDDREEALLDSLEREDSAQRVRQAIKGLSREHRAILLLCDIEGKGYEDVARALGCALGTVRSRVSRARAALKVRMMELCGEVEKYDGV